MILKSWFPLTQESRHNVVGCKWVYKVKSNSHGSVEQYKARLFAVGNHQQAGIDYHKTFSPVVKPPTSRLVLSLALTLVGLFGN